MQATRIGVPGKGEQASTFRYTAALEIRRLLQTLVVEFSSLLIAFHMDGAIINDTERPVANTTIMASTPGIIIMGADARHNSWRRGSRHVR